MANQVYEVTHDGLSAVISAKAATTVLKKALESEGHDSKSITGGEMRDVLMGPVYKELTSILPKDGVERTLKGIIKTLKKQAKEAKAKAAENHEAEVADVAEPAPETQEATPFQEDEPTPQMVAKDREPGVPASVLLFEDEMSSDDTVMEGAIESSFENVNLEQTPESPESYEMSAGTKPVESAVLSELSESSIPQEPVKLEVLPPQTITPQSIPTPVHQRAYSQEELNSFLMRFAQVENIKIVAIVQSNGVIKQSRGSGFDLAAISRIGSMGLKLLSRGRHIHSFYLAHQKGQLFLFPLADHTLIVVGNNEVNVGEIFSTLSTLEESI